MFKDHCVDDMDIDALTKYGFKYVPAILVVAAGSTQMGLHERSAAVRWANELIANRRQLAAMQSEHSRKLIQQSQVEDRQRNGLFDYVPEEAEGFSDTYSYWNDNIEADVDYAQPKSFMPYGQDEAHRIVTVQADERKFTEQDTRRLERAAENERKQQVIEMRAIMEQQQIQAVCQSQPM